MTAASRGGSGRKRPQKTKIVSILPDRTFDPAAPADLKALQERVHGAADPQ